MSRERNTGLTPLKALFDNCRISGAACQAEEAPLLAALSGAKPAVEA